MSIRELVSATSECSTLVSISGERSPDWVHNIQVRQLHFSMSVSQLDQEANQGSFRRNLSATCRTAMPARPILMWWHRHRHRTQEHWTFAFLTFLSNAAAGDAFQNYFCDIENNWRVSLCHPGIYKDQDHQEFFTVYCWMEKVGCYLPWKYFNTKDHFIKINISGPGNIFYWEI